MSIEDLTSEVRHLLPGAEVIADVSASQRAVTARIQHEDRPLIAKRHNDRAALAKEVEAYKTLPAQFRAELVAQSASLIVVEDLGNGPALSDLLLGDDPAAAQAGSLAWGAALGAALAPTMRRGRRAEPLSPGELRAGLESFATSFGVALPMLDDELASLLRPLNATNEWFAFGPTDTCPDNNRILADGTVKFFDFEGASWRHAASEAAYTIGPFCTCWCVALLPDGMANSMQDAFMLAFDPPSADAFREATRCAAILYVLQQIGVYARFLESDVEFGPQGKAPNTTRQFVPFRLRSVASLATDEPGLASLCTSLADAIAAKWPEVLPMQLYPAFR